MRIVELIKYSGLSYQELMAAPFWLIRTFELRRVAESDANKRESAKIKSEEQKLKSQHGRRPR